MLELTYSLNELPAIAQAIVNKFSTPGVVAIYAPMGAGKTTLIKQICAALDVRQVVSSPTFSIINEYYSDALQAPIYHFDFYRLKSIHEAIDIGVEDYFNQDQTFCFVEWPELVEDLLPPWHYSIHIEIASESTRDITF